MRHLIFVFLFMTSFAFSQDIDYCSKIETKEDKFSKKTTYRTPILDRISFSKEGLIVYIRIDIPGSTLNSGEKGVTLLLSDGTKIEKPNEKINVTYRDGYRYSVLFTLSKAQIDRIIKSPITDVKLFIYDAEIFDPEKYSEYLKCLIKM